MSENSHANSFRQEHLERDETIVSWATGYIGNAMGRGDDRQHNGILVITSRRVCFYRKGVLGEILETIPLPRITSVEQKSLLGHRVLRLHTSHDDLEFKTRVPKESFQHFVALLEQARKSGSQTGPTSGTHGETPLESLKKLAELRDAGIITPAEFESKKRELLARM